METVQINVAGMKCDGCVKSVTGVLREIPGVKEVDVSLAAHRATVTYDPASAGPAQLKAAIEDAGFDVTD